MLRTALYRTRKLALLLAALLFALVAAHPGRALAQDAPEDRHHELQKRENSGHLDGVCKSLPTGR